MGQLRAPWGPGGCVCDACGEQCQQGRPGTQERGAGWPAVYRGATPHGGPDVPECPRAASSPETQSVNASTEGAVGESPRTVVQGAGRGWRWQGPIERDGRAFVYDYGFLFCVGFSHPQ